MLGRALKATEVVHHRDGNKLNNDESNLIVFRTKADHVRHHAGWEAVIQADGVYVAVKPTPKNTCAICSTPTNNIMYCSRKCKGVAERKTDRPDVIQLTDLLSTKTWAEIGRIYGVSDNAVRKWARHYNIGV